MNDGKKYDFGKSRYDLVPPQAFEAAVRVISHGSQKYGDNNWQMVLDEYAQEARDTGVDRYFGALQRHAWAWRRGELLDPTDAGGTGINHMAHVACCALFLLCAQDWQAAASSERISGPAARAHNPTVSAEERARLEETQKRIVQAVDYRGAVAP